MAHTHGDAGPEHSHGGSAQGIGWDLLDSIVLGCAVVIAGILTELLYKSWRDGRVRYDLTPQGRAFTERDLERAWHHGHAAANDEADSDANAAEQRAYQNLGTDKPA